MQAPYAAVRHLSCTQVSVTGTDRLACVCLGAPCHEGLCTGALQACKSCMRGCCPSRHGSVVGVVHVNLSLQSSTAEVRAAKQIKGQRLVHTL